MNLFRIEYALLLGSAPFRFHSESHYLFLLTKSRLRLFLDGICSERDAGQMCYVLPGQTLLLEPLNELGFIDYFEFTMEEQEQHLFSSLPLPQGLNTPYNFSELSMRLRNMYQLFYSADKYRLQKLDIELQALLYGTASGDEDEASFSRSELFYCRMRRLRRLISDNPTCYKTVASAAAYVGLSVSHFEHLYKQYFSSSYLNDLIRSRIKRSCMLLNTTDWTIARIAKEVGYENEPFFFRQFKRLMGISPNAYRRMNVHIL